MYAQHIDFDILTRVVHIVMLVTCLWIAMVADMTAARSIRSPLSAKNVAKLGKYHSALTTGLIMLWLTGAYLIWLKTGFELANFSPKLFAKVIVVSLLSLNAAFIGKVAIRAFASNPDKTFGEFGFKLRLGLALSAALSTASWISAFCLGAIPALKTASPEMLIHVLGQVYGAAFFGAFIVALFVGRPSDSPASSSPVELLVLNAAKARRRTVQI